MKVQDLSIVFLTVACELTIILIAVISIIHQSGKDKHFKILNHFVHIYGLYTF